MKTQSKQIRQHLGCGWETPIDNARPWSPSNLKSDWKGEVEVCPGYTSKLPEVIEIARARVHWNKGQLAEFCDGKPAKAIVEGVEIMEGASNECQAWAMENPQKAGA